MFVFLCVNFVPKGGIEPPMPLARFLRPLCIPVPPLERFGGSRPHLFELLVDSSYFSHLTSMWCVKPIYHHSTHLYPHRDSNPDTILRRDMSYPLNDGGSLEQIERIELSSQDWKSGVITTIRYLPV